MVPILVNFLVYLFVNFFWKYYYEYDKYNIAAQPHYWWTNGTMHPT